MQDDLIVRQIHTSLESPQSLEAITCRSWIHPLEEAFRDEERKKRRREAQRKYYEPIRARTVERLRRFRERKRARLKAGLKD